MPHHPLRTRLRGERGSLPVALLVTFLVASLSSVVVARTVAGQEGVRYDRGATQGLQVADAGINEALYRLNNQILRSSDPLGPVAGNVGGTPYTWTPTVTGPGRWEVTSTATHRSSPQRTVERTVKAEIREQPLFNVGAFALIGATLAGGNDVDSYNSATQMWNTGAGAIGTNGSLSFNGSDSHLDRVLLFDWAANPDNARCVHSGVPVTCSTGTPQPANGKRTNIDAAFDIDSAGRVSFVEQQLADPACSGTTATWRAFPGNGNAPQGSSTTFPYGPGTYCFRSLTFNQNTVLPPEVTAANPLRLIVTDYVAIENGVNVACAGCPDTPPDPAALSTRSCASAGAGCPVASRLQIYTLRASSSQGSYAVRFGNHVKFAGAVYAPRSPCGAANGSNAQTQIYGSVICTELQNQGGWSFHYDEALATAAFSGEFFVTRWWEE